MLRLRILTTYWSGPGSGRGSDTDLTVRPGFRRWKPMAKHRTCSIEFKREIAPQLLGVETLRGLAKRHDISHNLIRVWVETAECQPYVKPGLLCPTSII
jgi:hypothetical protein